MKNQEQTELKGVDVDIEISLKEYGFAWIENETETTFYYGIEHDGVEYTGFDSCSFNLDLDLNSEFNWIKKDYWKGLLSFTGLTRTKFDDMPLTRKIKDLFDYFGYENIFGSSYGRGLTYDEVIKS